MSGWHRNTTGTKKDLTRVSIGGIRPLNADPSHYAATPADLSPPSNHHQPSPTAYTALANPKQQGSFLRALPTQVQQQNTSVVDSSSYVMIPKKDIYSRADSGSNAYSMTPSDSSSNEGADSAVSLYSFFKASQTQTFSPVPVGPKERFTNNNNNDSSGPTLKPRSESKLVLMQKHSHEEIQVPYPKSCHELQWEQEVMQQLPTCSPLEMEDKLLKHILGNVGQSNRHSMAKFDRDWNKEFQTILEMDDHEEKFVRLKQLAQDFVYTAETYGKIIISESCLPVRLKTVPPVQVGGIAGGDKFIAGGVLFKFCNDRYGIYSGHINAMKAGANDLKGLEAYFTADIPGLHFPLMAVIDYRGSRLLALSVLPISKRTIHYGSVNAGKEVHKSDARLNLLMERAGKALNLKRHVVGMQEPVEIDACCDLEGHLGEDDRFYLLDFARVAPPEPPTVAGSLLANLFRINFVKKYRKPLSSDAFSAMGKESRREHNAEIFEAFQFLVHTTIPDFAKTCPLLQQQPSDFGNMAFQLSEKMHAAGIGLRHLGRVRNQLSELHPFRKVILMEVVARVGKNILRSLMRAVGSLTGVPSEGPFVQCIVRFFESLYESHGSVWDDIKVKVQYRFVDCLAMTEKGLNLRDMVHLPTVVNRICDLAGVALVSPHTSEDGPPSDQEIAELKTKVKHMNLIDQAEAIILFYSAKRNPQRAQSLLMQAHDRLARLIEMNPTNFRNRVMFARVLGALNRISGDAPTKTDFFDYYTELFQIEDDGQALIVVEHFLKDLSQLHDKYLFNSMVIPPRVNQAVKLFDQFFYRFPGVPRLPVAVGNFFLRLQNLDTAEKFFSKALEVAAALKTEEPRAHEGMLVCVLQKLAHLKQALAPQSHLWLSRKGLGYDVKARTVSKSSVSSTASSPTDQTHQQYQALLKTELPRHLGECRSSARLRLAKGHGLLPTLYRDANKYMNAFHIFLSDPTSSETAVVFAEPISRLPRPVEFWVAPDELQAFHAFHAQAFPTDNGLIMPMRMAPAVELLPATLQQLTLSLCTVRNVAALLKLPALKSLRFIETELEAAPVPEDVLRTTALDSLALVRCSYAPEWVVSLLTSLAPRLKQVIISHPDLRRDVLLPALPALPCAQVLSLDQCKRALATSDRADWPAFSKLGTLPELRFLQFLDLGALYGDAGVTRIDPILAACPMLEYVLSPHSRHLEYFPRIDTTFTIPLRPDATDALLRAKTPRMDSPTLVFARFMNNLTSTVRLAAPPPFEALLKHPALWKLELKLDAPQSTFSTGMTTPTVKIVRPSHDAPASAEFCWHGAMMANMESKEFWSFDHTDFKVSGTVTTSSTGAVALSNFGVERQTGDSFSAHWLPIGLFNGSRLSQSITVTLKARQPSSYVLGLLEAMMLIHKIA